MGFQQGLSGLHAAAQNLDVIGNNVANANTVGAKAARAEFADLYANSLNAAGNNQVGIGVTVDAVAQQFTQGDIFTTDNPLDIAINGNGFFEVSKGGTTTYTRNGQFGLDAEGYIINAQGARLQGYMADLSGTITPTTTDLRLNIDGGPPGTELTGFAIADDGTIEARYSDGQTIVRGQITLVNFTNPQGLAPLGGNAWAQTSESGAPLAAQAPGSGSLGGLRSGALEQSNVDLTAELVNMIMAQRVYQANAQTIRTQDQVMQTIVNLR